MVSFLAYYLIIFFRLQRYYKFCTYASKFTTFIYFSLFFESGNLEMSGKKSIFAPDLGEEFS